MCVNLVSQFMLVRSLFSLYLQVTPSVSFTEEEVAALTDRIQNAGTEVVNAKAGAVSNIIYWLILNVSLFFFIFLTGISYSIHGLCWSKVLFLRKLYIVAIYKKKNKAWFYS